MPIIFRKPCFVILKIALIAFLAIFFTPTPSKVWGFIWPPVTLAESGLVINEIMYDVEGTDTNHEWIELYNSGSSEIDLTGWKFNDGDDATNHVLNAPPKNGGRGSMIIAPAGYLILTGNASTTILDLLNYSGSVIDTVMSLSNTAATLKILNKEGAEIASANYSKEMGANGNGKTLSWDGTAFKESSTDGGTPGEINSVLLSLPSPAAPSTSTSTSSSSQNTASTEPSLANYSDKILINEFMPAPSSAGKPETNGNEWVELTNLSEETIDLSNWQIDDGPDGSSPQSIPGGTLIQPDQFSVIQLSKDILNNEGDQIRLLWPDGQIIHSITYQKASTGFSSSRFEDGLWLWTENPTPGTTNKKSTPASQTATTQTHETNQPKINPLIETAQENTIAQKMPQPKNQSAPASTQNSESPAQPQPPSSAQAAITTPFQNQISSKTSSSNIILSLVAILILSTATSIGLIYFKRKKSPPLKKNG